MREAADRGIKCPHCFGGGTGVTDSRPSGDMIRRRRSCPKCDRRFTTFEMITDDAHAGTFYAAQQLRGLLDDLPVEQRQLIERLVHVLARSAARLPVEGDVALP